MNMINIPFEEELARWRLLALMAVAVCAGLTLLLCVICWRGPSFERRDNVNVYRIELVGKPSQAVGADGNEGE